MIEASLKTNYERQTDNDRKRAERKQQEYSDIDWEDLYHRNQLSSLRVDELELYTAVFFTLQFSHRVP